MKYRQIWTENEVEQYQDLFKKFSTDFRQIAIEMNRTYNQIRSHYYNLQRKSNVQAQKIKDQSLDQNLLVNSYENQLENGCVLNSNLCLDDNIKSSNQSFTYILFCDLD
ncbi:SANT/Myb_domain [Hexamita inflata]|uniref:SANT/Myb domain n=1 Tax=Hexamita inflata TaxID=28002 RepID=A0AA86THY7_9EUKA|nr:SANT/Myb domain [Hexamita inflata]CAI9918625.1 SANT/Myb domain [Hexamita inflata]